VNNARNAAARLNLLFVKHCIDLGAAPTEATKKGLERHTPSNLLQETLYPGRAPKSLASSVDETEPAAPPRA
jgi:hypothetical protein